MSVGFRLCWCSGWAGLGTWVSSSGSQKVVLRLIPLSDCSAPGRHKRRSMGETVLIK